MSTSFVMVATVCCCNSPSDIKDPESQITNYFFSDSITMKIAFTMNTCQAPSTSHLKL